MSKCQKLSFFPLEDLPDEILLKVLSSLDIKGVLQCGQSSTRLRKISNDKSLWSKLNLRGQYVPYGLIEKAMQNGCEYLKLIFASSYEKKNSVVPWKLKYLDISQCELGPMIVNCEGLLQNCHFLEKLSVIDLKLRSSEIDQICQNGETLQILSLGGFNQWEWYSRTELIQRLFTNCHQLTEFNLCSAWDRGMRDAQLWALVKNLTPNILKLSLAFSKIKDEHVNTLVLRCKKITELNLKATSITNDSVESIVEHLNFLEKLDVSCNNIEVTTLLQLKSIPTLKTLRCFEDEGEDEDEEETEKIKHLKLHLPHVIINEDYLQIARPRKDSLSNDHDWFWEIRANQQNLFPRAR